MNHTIAVMHAVGLATVLCTGQEWPPDPPLAEPVYTPQRIGIAPPRGFEMWLSSPTRHGYPWNIIRIWLPEAVNASGANGQALWNWNMQQGRNVWNQEQGVQTSREDLPGGGILLRRVTVHEDQVSFSLTVENQGQESWSRVAPGSCLQLSAAPDYEDNTGERTYLILDGEPTPTIALAITDPGMRGSGQIGDRVTLKDGSGKRVTEGVFFVVSKDGKYVLGYSWQPAHGFFYNRAGIVACIHIHPLIGPVEPGQSATTQGTMFIHEGDLAGALERYQDWKASVAP